MRKKKSTPLIGKFLSNYLAIFYFSLRILDTIRKICILSSSRNDSCIAINIINFYYSTYNRNFNNKITSSAIPSYVHLTD